MTTAEVVLAPLHWVERARGRKGLALLTLYAVVLSIAAMLLWWAGSLRSLPDIGDPFDVSAYRLMDVAVPEADNAYPLYRDATERLKALTNGEVVAINKAIAGPWSAVPPQAREALERHRDALELWKTATNRPSVHIVAGPGPIETDAYEVLSRIRITFTHMALLEAARLEDQGDMAAAWSWYAAILRAHNHAVATRLRSWHRGINPLMSAAIGRWQSDPRADPALLRKALDELQAIHSARPSFASTLKNEYVYNVAELEMAQEAENQHVRTEDQWYKFMPGYSRAIMIARREPERSRRILRLIYANLMAHIDDPPAQQPKIVPPGVFDLGVDPLGQDIARRISPQNLGKEIARSLLPNYLIDGQDTIGRANGERRIWAGMILGMAAELYQQERGTIPPTFKDMVGPYLKSLPSGAIETEGPGAR